MKKILSAAAIGLTFSSILAQIQSDQKPILFENFAYVTGQFFISKIGGFVGLNDSTGRAVLPPVYLEIYPLGGGFWHVTNVDSLCGVVNSKGEEKLPFRFSRCLSFGLGKFFAARNMDEKWQLFDRDGQHLANFEWHKPSNNAVLANYGLLWFWMPDRFGHHYCNPMRSDSRVFRSGDSTFFQTSVDLIGVPFDKLKMVSGYSMGCVLRHCDEVVGIEPPRFLIGQMSGKVYLSKADEKEQLWLADDGSLHKKTSVHEKEARRIYMETAKYPDEARANGIEGTVVVSFWVDENGHVIEAEIERDIGGGCGDEALRCVRGSLWTPAFRDWVLVRSRRSEVFEFKKL